MQTRFYTLTTLLLVLACGSSGKSKDPAAGSGGSGAGGSNTGSAGNSPISVGGAVHSGEMFAGAECPDIGLPDAYALPNVKAEVDGSNVRISFDPQGDAHDYRVYALPKAGDVSGAAVKNAVYRCAGGGTVPSPAPDDVDIGRSYGARARVASNVEGFTRTTDDAKLGYVFTTPADDRIPVYAVGDANVKADNTDCYEMRWPESREKRYLTDKAERDKLVAAHWRDDGVAFYVPKPGAADTELIYQAELSSADWGAYIYTKAGKELDSRKGHGDKISEAFSVYTQQADGAEPLLRVYYGLTCDHGHDELVPGQARFDKAYLQGATPVTELHFSGITAETTLVVEALDALCPFQGTLAPMSRAARLEKFDGGDVDYPQFQTPDELSASSPVGELFVNGQGDGTKPKAISRACVKVKPTEPPKMDFSYDGAPETFSAPRPRNFQIWDMDSPTFDVTFHNVATDEWSIGSMFGELWITYGDWAGDTNGKVRMTPKAPATLAADSFVHASMEVDMVSTQRRYPQLLFSDQDVAVPVQDHLTEGTTVVIQTFGGITTPVSIEIQFCDHRIWDVNKQCPKYDVQVLSDAGGKFLSPREEVTGLMGVDRTVRFDAYTSTSRVYLFANARPYGCVDLPDSKLKAGAAKVTFGDVLYHSLADLEAWYPFHLAKMHTTTTRHYSNLGFSSGVPAPAWDESLIPCVAASGLKE